MTHSQIVDPVGGTQKHLSGKRIRSSNTEKTRRVNTCGLGQEQELALGIGSKHLGASFGP